MSKRRYILTILLLFSLYIAFAWQYLITQQLPEKNWAIRLYYAGGFVLFLATVFCTYLMEKSYNLSRLATIIYLALLISGAPFLYNLILYIMLNNIPALFE